MTRAAVRLAELDWYDTFDRPDGPLGPAWVDGHEVFPGSFEPLGVYGGAVVVADPMTRPGVYDGLPSSGNPPTGGRLYPGIGCAWRDTGSTAPRVLVRWAGDVGISERTHIEATPLLHVSPGTARFGFGCWLSEFSEGNGFILAGYIGDPPESFASWMVATHAMSHTDGQPRDFELRSSGTTVQAFLDGELLTAWSNGYGDTLPLHADVQGSTLHGFAVDAHFTDPALVPTSPAVLSVRYRGIA